MLKDISISIIVPIFNGARYLPMFWSSLLPNVTEETEIIIVNDGSSEDVMATVPQFPASPSVIKLENRHSRGYASAVNKAMNVASGDIFIHLNTDIILCGNTVAEIRKTLTEHPDIGIVGAKLLYPQTGRTQHCGITFSACNKMHMYEHLPADHSLTCQSQEVQATTGTILGFRHETYKEVGIMDQDLFNCNEDIDYCMRVRKVGMKVYVNTEAVAYHWVSQSGHARFVRQIENEAVFWRKWGNSIIPDIEIYAERGLVALQERRPAINLREYHVLNLSKGGADLHILKVLNTVAGQPLEMFDFRQVNNPIDDFWLPMLLPYDLMRNPTPFLYIVDSIISLENNYYWFSERKKLSHDEMIADHNGNFLLASDLVDVTR